MIVAPCIFFIYPACLALYLLTDPMRVTMVRTVVTPNPTLAGAELLSR